MLLSTGGIAGHVADTQYTQPERKRACAAICHQRDPGYVHRIPHRCHPQPRHRSSAQDQHSSRRQKETTKGRKRRRQREGASRKRRIQTHLLAAVPSAEHQIRPVVRPVLRARTRRAKGPPGTSVADVRRKLTLEPSFPLPPNHPSGPWISSSGKERQRLACPTLPDVRQSGMVRDLTRHSPQSRHRPEPSSAGRDEIRSGTYLPNEAGADYFTIRGGI